MIDRLKEFKVLGDDRGELVALEESQDIPFDIKRVFYIYATQKGVSRGNHAHYKTKQFLIAVSGSCKVTLDDGEGKETFVLDKPSLGLFQDAMVWGSMHDFSEDCVLVVLADAAYDSKDYINEYTDFVKELPK